MPDLIAQGIKRQHRWRRCLVPGSPIFIGRKQGVWGVPWDDQISRTHARLIWNPPKLSVTVEPGSTNPLFFQGQSVKTCQIKAGQHFVIGSTTFAVVSDQASIEPIAQPPVAKQTFSHQELRSLRFQDANDRLELLQRFSEQIVQSPTDHEIGQALPPVLFEAISSASAVALIIRRSDGQLDFIHWDQAADPTSPQDLLASKALIDDSIQRQESVLHTWQPDASRFRWAMCSPVVSQAKYGWAIYVAGQISMPAHESRSWSDTLSAELRDGLKFVDLLAANISHVCQVRSLQQQQAALRHFFSPQVLESLATGDPSEFLEPREVDVTVLFCDLRGFSRETEKSAHDLFGILERVSEALGVLTKQILANGGVIGDFHGDAAMGFWGWPISQPDGPHHAARAALAIQKAFRAAAETPDHVLADFRVGMGIASGRAVAGRIGTADQAKVTVFGPVVNLASRLESMTKQLQTPILMDEQTAQQLRSQPSPEMRQRRLARVRPVGIQAVIQVHELLAPFDEDNVLAAQHLAAYKEALTSFLNGDWDTAWAKLHDVPAMDRGKDFLTLYIASRNRRVPDGWNGVIELDSK